MFDISIKCESLAISSCKHAKIGGFMVFSGLNNKVQPCLMMISYKLLSPYECCCSCVQQMFSAHHWTVMWCHGVKCYSVM